MTNAVNESILVDHQEALHAFRIWTGEQPADEALRAGRMVRARDMWT